MPTTYPGTTIEVMSLEKCSSRSLFDGIFATGGITLSQVCIMTGLEPYMVQNWVKRGFVTPPKKRVYTCTQFARIIIINMLKDSIQIDRICSLIKLLGGLTADPADDLISDDELYHRYVDMISEESINISDEASVLAAAESAAEGFVERIPNAKKMLVRILQVMLYAHTASRLRVKSDEMLSTLL